MTTSPSPAEGTGSPAGGPPPPAPPGPLTDALADLVRAGTLTDAQARAVVSAWSARATATTRAPATSPAPVRHAPAWRTRLLEAAIYLGAAFVLAAVGIVVGQAWTEMSRGVQVILTSGLTALGLVAGLMVGWPIRPAPGRDLDPTHAVRRRSASVILTAAAALAAGTVAVTLGDRTGTAVASCAAALAVMVLCQVVAPSVLSELALFGAATLVVGTAADAVAPDPGRGEATEAWTTRGRLIAGLLLGFGALWAWVLARRLHYRVLGVTIALGLCVFAALVMQDGGTTPTVVVLAVLAAATLVTYLRDPLWPWITASVVSATAAVFVVAGDTVGYAVAFLVAGLLLLGGVTVVVLLRRRRGTDARTGPPPTGRPES